MRIFDQKNSCFSKKNNLVIAAIGIFSLGLITSLLEDASAEEEIFPLWLKNIAVWWGEDQITDQEFVSTLQYLRDKQILVIPDREIEKFDCGPGLILNDTNDCVIHDKSDTTGIFFDTIDEQQKIVVSWIKVTTLWWGQDKIDDQDFMNALQYLAENNVLTKESKAPKPQIKLKPLPGDLIVWPKIDKIADVKIQGHGNTESYNLQIKIVDEYRRAIAADGTISIVIVDDRNRILYLDAFSVKKQMNSFGPGSYVDTFKTFFDESDQCINCFVNATDDHTIVKVYSWEIETEDIKPGFTDSGIAKIVFTDRYGNNFESGIIPISIPQFD